MYLGGEGAAGVDGPEEDGHLPDGRHPEERGGGQGLRSMCWWSVETSLFFLDHPSPHLTTAVTIKQEGRRSAHIHMYTP